MVLKSLHDHSIHLGTGFKSRNVKKTQRSMGLPGRTAEKRPSGCFKRGLSGCQWGGNPSWQSHEVYGNSDLPHGLSARFFAPSASLHPTASLRAPQDRTGPRRPRNVARRSATFSGKGPQQALELLHVIADSTGAHPGTRERRPETNLHGLLHAMRYTPSVTHMESQVSRRDRTNSMLQHGAKTASTTHHLRSVSRRRTPRRRSSVLVRHVLSVRFGPLRRRPAHQLQLRHPSRSMKVKVSL